MPNHKLSKNVYLEIIHSVVQQITMSRKKTSPTTKMITMTMIMMTKCANLELTHLTHDWT
jgi:hypothetical protein